MEILILYTGFLLAAYAVIGNDVIQTLGTFITSNNKTHWSALWAFASVILTATLIYGWYFYNGDVSYQRLDKIPLPETIKWWYLIAPLTLLLITRFGIPVSTTFMILSIFSSQQVIEKMIIKSVYGYGLSFVSAFLLYILIAKRFESKKSIDKVNSTKQKRFWIIAQWFSTAFLWSQWLIQDFANIFVFMPRQLSLIELVGSLVIILTIMAYIFKSRGGKIQEIVNQKVNTRNIRSATIIDLCYGIILFLYGNINSIPMSTTWTFIGILAGREIAINYLLNTNKLKNSYKLIAKDFAKVNIGLAISIFIAYLIQLIKALYI
jgi:phosphate/sulfate permease